MKRNLSDLQREKPSEAYTIVLTDGTEVEFVSPKSLHWTILTRMDSMSPAQQIEALVPNAGHRKALRDDPNMDGEALEWLMDGYQEHYGLASVGEGNGSA